MLPVLIVEDQPAVATALAVLFEVRGLACEVAAGPAEALARLDRGPVGVVVQDMNFTPDETSGREGAELFREIHRREPELPVLLLTAWTSLATAVELVREGAADYLAKPWDDEKLASRVRELLARRERRLGDARLAAREARRHEDFARRYDLRGCVYSSAGMHRLVTLALQVAASEAPVLITGPSGAGKDKIAEIVQANSPRKSRPFVRVNAGALPDELLEAELFGAESGAYTGATRRRVGRFEAADGGTLFLDEIGNLSPAAQQRLLRVLASGEFERLGSSQTRRVDVRLLCATNADLEAEMAAGRFREDLFYRLNVVELAVPPLAERPEDVLAVAEALLAELAVAPGGEPWRLSAEASEALLLHPWPGNVRELRNVLQRATVVAPASLLRAEDLGLCGTMPARAQPARPAPAGGEPRLSAERVRIERALADSGGVVARAAETLGLSRQALYRKMEKHGLAVERQVRG